MLRGPTDTNPPPPSGARVPTATTAGGGFPTGDQPYDSDERPVGVLFYQGKESFFLPYYLLQTMRYQEGRLTLVFAPDEVEVHGRGLHELYVLLAAQRVWRVVEQGPRQAAISEAVVVVTRIERKARQSDNGQLPLEG